MVNLDFKGKVYFIIFEGFNRELVKSVWKAIEQLCKRKIIEIWVYVSEREELQFRWNIDKILVV